MKIVSFVVIVAVGILLGLILIKTLPKSHPEPLAAQIRNPEVVSRLRRINWVPPASKTSIASPKPAVTQHTPWIIVGIGIGLMVVFQKNETIVKLGGAVLTAGVTAVLGTH